MRNLLIMMCILLSISIKAQTDYQPLKSVGSIPDEFLTRGAVEYQKDKQKIESTKYSEKKVEDDFYLKHNYFINDLFKDGFVLFGDDISKYINDLGQKIVSQIPDLMEDKEVKFYVLRNSTVNAFSTQKGYIFINLGLIAQCENEAQLAFVISHELVHYIKNHGVKGYLEGSKISKSRDTKNLSSSEKEELYAEYSKESEFEADEIGLEKIYLKLGYDIEEVLNVFDVLLYSYLPFDEKVFNNTYFDDEYFKFPEKITEKDVNSITAIEGYDDKMSTHPNIKKRREKMIDLIAEGENKPNGVNYVVSQEGFQNSRKVARYESCQLYLNNMDYAKAYYSAYLLLQDDPNSQYLKRIQAYSIYALSKYFNRLKDIKQQTKTIWINGNSMTIDDDPDGSYAKMTYIKNMFLELDSIEGLSSQFSNMIRKMERKELNILAVRHIFDAMENDPENDYLKSLAKSSIKDLIEINEMQVSDFLEKPLDSTKASEFKALTDEEYEALGKYDKIKYNKEKEKYDQTGYNGNYLATAFIKYFSKKSTYKELYQEIADKISNNEEERETKEKPNIFSRWSSGRKYFIENSFKKKNSVKKMIMINPSMTNRTRGSYDYIKSEKHESEFLAAIKRASNATNIKTTILDAYLFDSEMVDAYNDLGLSTRFYVEFIDHEYLIGSKEIICSNANYMIQLADNYSTDYFAISGLYNNFYGNRIGNAIFSIPVHLVTFPYLLPRTAVNLVMGDNYTEFLYQAVNIRTGELVYYYNNKVDMPDKKFVLNSIIYDAFYNMNNPKK
ncbi:MAG: M48 family metallopeptidase [Bacteroidales bacterium]|nr:M48 family metallopeptidase [Bacteroidales bacterium]